jgi:hypothetical protein
MKFLLPVLLAVAPVPAAEAQILGCHKQACSHPRDKAAKPPKRVGRAGDCPQYRDGYCRTASEWWEHKMLSQ